MRNGQQSFSGSLVQIMDVGTTTWERGYCDLCCIALSKAFMLDCRHTFCDHCMVVLVDGNKSASQDTIECPFCLAISKHLTSLDSRIAPVIPTPVLVTCQAPNHKTTGDTSIQYFCVQTEELICTSCASSLLYTGKALLTVQEAAEHFGNIIHDKTNAIRLAVAEIRKHVLRLRRQQDNLNIQLEGMINNLHVKKSEIISAITEKFTALEQALIKLTDIRREEIIRDTNNITQRIRTVMDAVSSSEKHVAQQDPLSFLAEAKSLVSMLSRKLKALSGHVETRQPIRPLHLPQLGSTASILGAIRALDLREQSGRARGPD